MGSVHGVRLVSFLDVGTGTDLAQWDQGQLAGMSRTGVVVGDEVVDLTAEPFGLPGDMAAVVSSPGAMEVAQRAARSGPRLPLDAVRLLAPVPLPPKVLAIGMNYAAHVAELGREAPEHQVWFNKQRTCVVGPGAPVVIPSVSNMVDYEGELAFVVGRHCRDVPAADAMSVIAGFTVMNDVSVRDWQWRAPTWTMGKSFDTHGPLGPWLVTPDELGDPGHLDLSTYVNGERRQHANTADMLFGIGAMVELLSRACTLEPGDVVSTGTPPGVGASFDPPRWLCSGDVVRIEIEGIGALENPVR
ncbi:MAG: fumarylacetoacetate hydrolase family protein [Acidimicrobiales bacterium]